MSELLFQSWFWTCLLLIQRVAPPKVLNILHARGDVSKAALKDSGAAFFSSIAARCQPKFSGRTHETRFD